MSNCKPQGYKVLVSDIRKATKNKFKNDILNYYSTIDKTLMRYKNDYGIGDYFHILLIYGFSEFLKFLKFKKILSNIYLIENKDIYKQFILFIRKLKINESYGKNFIGSSNDLIMVFELPDIFLDDLYWDSCDYLKEYKEKLYSLLLIKDEYAWVDKDELRFIAKWNLEK